MVLEFLIVKLSNLVNGDIKRRRLNLQISHIHNLKSISNTLSSYAKCCASETVESNLPTHLWHARILGGHLCDYILGKVDVENIPVALLVQIRRQRL